MRDGATWSRIRLAERANLEPWEPSGEVDWAERHGFSAWPAMFSSLRGEARRGRMLPYVIELDGGFCGQLTIGNVTHGALRSAWIGYWVASDVTGSGVATVRPENAASRRVLAKAGFREEGLLKRYLNVDGGWRDHLLVAITAEEVDGSVAAGLVRRGLAGWH
jgi:ribosomal-protein-alanine N-acetyltransferase